MEIGLIGLGLMGQAMAERLLGAGHRVCGYDLRPEACAEARALGVEILEDVRDAGPRCSFILLSLLNSDNRRELLWGPQRLTETLRPGTILLDSTTGRPEDIEEDHARLAAQGVRLVDICLSGSSQVLREGRSLALIGGRRDEAPYAELLAAFSKTQYYFDAPGQGNRVKLIVNLVFGLNRLVLAEALGLAERAGFDLGLILEILKAGETYSVAMDTKGPKMISGTYAPAVARLGQHAKDVHLILDYARRVGARVPVSEVHAQLIDDLLRGGWGELDNAAIFKAYAS